jgi:folylpolyglutamate synthase/dihydropteroate synthase
VVHNPSAGNAYPDLVRESIENQKIVTLAEAMVEDKKAQKYLEKEIKMFLSKLITK